MVGAEHKRDPADFALWKLAKPGEPSWPSPWGDGRPGWHTECVVMSLELLGEGFDLHCGGLDLKFPHHENERAQAVALGKRFANHWMHHAFVVDAEGEKMSKSLGNFDNLLDLIEPFDQPRLPDGAAAEPLPLPDHDRPETTCEAAEQALARLDAFAARSGSVGPTGRDDADPVLIDAFTTAMDDDLDTPKAMALLFDTVPRANAALEPGRPRGTLAGGDVREVVATLGLELRSGGSVPDDVSARAGELDAARAAGDYAAADRIRDAAERGRLDRRDEHHRYDRSAVTRSRSSVDRTRIVISV